MGLAFGLAAPLLGRRNSASTIDEVGQPASQLQHASGVGVTLKMPWMASPYQDDQLNQDVMSKARWAKPGSQPTVCSAPMP